MKIKEPFLADLKSLEVNASALFDHPAIPPLCLGALTVQVGRAHSLELQNLIEGHQEREESDNAELTGALKASEAIITELRASYSALRAKTLAVIEQERDAIETYLKDNHNSYKNRDKRFEYGEFIAQNDGMENRYWAALQFIRDYRRSRAARALADELKGEDING